MDDLSKRAIKLVIEYCLGNCRVRRGENLWPATLARVEDALSVAYAEIYDNHVYQYRWALRHPIVREAVTLAMVNRFPSR
jgi:hypothetical protein